MRVCSLRKTRTIISLMMCMALLLSGSVWDSITAGAETAESTKAVYAADSYMVAFQIISQWEGGYNAEVTITNTGDEKIENWKMNMIPAEGTEITGIWNAAKKELDTEDKSPAYRISNVGWNQDIAPGENVSFGFQASCITAEAPQECYLTGQAKTAGESTCRILYRIMDDWQEGCIVETSILNLTDTEIEDWKLSFTWEDAKVTKIWNAVMTAGEDGRYNIDNDGCNSVIPAGKSVIFSMLVETDTQEMAFPKDAVLVYYGCGDEILPKADEEPKVTEQPEESLEADTNPPETQQPAAATQPAVASAPEEAEEVRRWNRSMMHMDEEKVQEAVERVTEPIKVAIMDSGVDEMPEISLAGRKNLIPGGDEMTEMYEDATGHGTALAALMVFDREEAAEEEYEGYTYEYFMDEEAALSFFGTAEEDNGTDVEDDAEDEDYDSEEDEENEDGSIGLGEFIENNQADIDGINPNMELYSIRVLDEAGEAPVSRIIEGIEWAVKNNIKILNISSGTEKDSEKLHNAIKEAYDAGMLIVAAGGNDGGVQYPAAYEEVICAGSVDYTGEAGDECKKDSTVELAAPGEGVLSVGAFGIETEVSGTSMAAGEISAAASILWQQDAKADNRFIRSLLQAGANQSGETSGYGIIDCGYSMEIYDEFKEAYEKMAAEEDKADNTGGDMDAGELLELMEEAGIEENTEELDTVEESETEDGILSANWGGANHLKLLKYENGEELEESLKALRVGIRLQDGEISTLKGKKEYAAWHGYYEENYVAGYLYLSKLAASIFGDGKIGSKEDYKITGKISDISKMNGIIQIDGIHTSGKKEADVSWDTIFRCKLGTAIVGASDISLIDKKHAIEDSLTNRALIVYGMAMHTMSDAFAHSCWGCKEENNRCVWGELKWSDATKTALSENNNKEMKYNDNKTVRPQRYRATKQAVYNTLDHIKVQKNGKKVKKIAKGKVRDFCSRVFIKGNKTECKDIIDIHDYIYGSSKKPIGKYLKEGFGMKRLCRYAKKCGAGEKVIKYLQRIDLKYLRQATEDICIVKMSFPEGKKKIVITLMEVSAETGEETMIAHVQGEGQGEDIYMALKKDFSKNQSYRICCTQEGKSSSTIIDADTPFVKPDSAEGDIVIIEQWDIDDFIQGYQYPYVNVCGRIVEAENNGDYGNRMEDVRVSLCCQDENGAERTVQTDKNGSYRFDECLSGLYELRIEKEGYRTVKQKLFLSGRQELYNNLIIRLIPDSISGKGEVRGCIRDSFTREGIEGLTLRIRKGIDERQGEIVQTVCTDKDGNYRASGLQTGHYCAEVVDENSRRKKEERYITTYLNIIIMGEQLTAGQDAAVVRCMESGQMQVVLSWKSIEKNNLHIIFGIFYGHDYYIRSFVKEIEYNDRLVAELNERSCYAYGIETVDSAYGIETVKVYDVEELYFSYSICTIGLGDTELSEDGLCVRIYYDGMLWEEFYAPDGKGYVWDVFWYNVRENKIMTQSVFH